MHESKMANATNKTYGNDMDVPNEGYALFLHEGENMSRAYQAYYPLLVGLKPLKQLMCCKF